MDSLLKWFLTTGLVQTRIKKVIASVSTAAGAVVLGYITTHLHTVSLTDAQGIASAVSGLALILLSTLYDQIDVSTVNAKLQIAASTGSLVQVNDPTLIKAVKSVPINVSLLEQNFKR